MSFWTDKTQRKRYKGFTLVEMSIVLVIIGLILGAISIGKDLQRDAEYNKIKQKFVDGWVRAYNTYYQRTGVVLGDLQERPQYMVNGRNFSTDTDTVSGGDMTGETSPGEICQGVSEEETGSGDLHELMDRAGVRMPPGRAEGLEDRYVYLDTNGNPQEVQICFQWNPPGTNWGAGNVMVIRGITPDLARALDVAVDGKADAIEGLFRQANLGDGNYSTSGQSGMEWRAYNSQSSTETGANLDNPTNRDEDQVRTVTAHYKMNQ
ncbi:MAG: prepilin-type N-terminal cleavage/methylation domain-containing protein [Hydrogenovibrio sp.]|uniref:type II secretion system protein n=1 Tax=Hydrogenovibrio sp. TaxID=2065821 RepID=UPI002870984F|nr:prepilin-type N-terminal cleavage/methylation domain-containing protein [Hydrogenovibrio sp.]MDR9497829.1 prepilin-type N-terminal cleavage/methylation domain-containing protein [Hydrogenovibrio sp.]